MQQNKSFLFIVSTLFLILSFSLITGCSQKFELSTESGRLELNLKSLQISHEEIESMIANKFINQNYFIEEWEKGELVLRQKPSAGWLSTTQQQLEFNFLYLPDRTRILGRIFRLELQGKEVFSKNEITGNAQHAKRVQKALNEIQEALENKDQTQKTDTSTPESSSETAVESPGTETEAETSTNVTVPETSNSETETSEPLISSPEDTSIEPPPALGPDAN